MRNTPLADQISLQLRGSVGFEADHIIRCLIQNLVPAGVSLKATIEHDDNSSGTWSLITAGAERDALGAAVLRLSDPEHKGIIYNLLKDKAVQVGGIPVAIYMLDTPLLAEEAKTTQRAEAG